MAAKFYIKKGAQEASIPSEPAEGTIYIAKDTSKMYIDYDDSTRLTLNASAADKLANTAYINGIGFNGEQNVSFYGKCSTAAGVAAKTVTIDNFSLEDGVTIHVKFVNSNSASKPTLDVSGTGAKYICMYGTQKASTSSSTSGWRAGAIVTLTYDGDNDVWIRDFWENTTYNIPVGYCATAAATAAKTASCSGYTLTAKTYLHILIRYANSAEDELTLNVNSTGDKPIYINDAISSANNYTLPAGTYIVYYDGTNFYFRTDGILPGSIKKAGQLITARTLTIGATGKIFDGSANASWNCNEVGFFDVAGRGIELADGADMDLIDCGNFYSNNSTKSATLVNPPLTSAGFRIISQKGYNSSATAYNWQYAMTSNRKIYQRFRDGNNNWSDWGTVVLNHSYDAVGSSSVPVYVTAAGKVTACSTTLDVSITGNAATATKVGTVTVGSTAQPIYLNEGIATPISDTVGGTAQPIYLKDGVATIISDTIGSTTQPIYLKDGVATIISDTIGSTTQPAYLNAGVITVGSVYAGGTKVTLNGTEKGATTASFYAPTGAGTSGQYLKSNGSGAPTWATTTVSNTWTDGTTAGPTIKTTVNGVTGTAVAIPSASSSVSGIVTTGAQTMAGNKTWSGTATFSSTATFNSTVNLNNTVNLKASYQIKSTGRSSSWYNGRDSAMLRQTSYTGYNAILSCKTTNGSWELGPYTSDYLYFVYNSDTGYNSGTNTSGEYFNTVKLASSGKLYGACWNDYAEFRICNEDFNPGQVVFENGDDTVSISTQRLQRGCSITSDTFGFAIGETDEAKCPIAVSGRVLAYPYESKEEFAKHIGWPVCSGPNGTVSIMTEEEEEKYPSRIIGTISAIPDYDVWGSENVKVNGRIWIKIK